MRKLTAIMFTDIEGFTALMQRDETVAVSMLEQHNQIFHHCTEQHKGKIIKYMGDGTLTIFNSVLQAIDCAVALQKAFRKDSPIPVRIGIHSGEVIFENRDIIGDAVNLASRIQGQARAGSILISEKVQEELINHPEIRTVPLGAYRLKNVINPVNLYAVVAEGLVVPDPKNDFEKIPEKKLFGLMPVSGSIMLIAGILIFAATYFFINYVNSKSNADYLRTIAVLPFKNIGKDVDNYLAEGLTEEMISLLSENPGLTVKRIPQDISDHYTDAALSRLLTGIHVGCVLEGKILESDEGLVIYVKLRDLRTSEYLWSNTFNEESKQILKVQRVVSRQINESLKTGFDSRYSRPFDKKSPDKDAHDLYLKGRYAQKRRDYAALKEANYYFQKALEKDSTYALAYSGISDSYVIMIDNSIIPYNTEAVETARMALNNAFRLDSNLAEVRASKAIFLSSLEGRRNASVYELRKALEIAPNYTEAHQWYAIELAAEGQFDSALVHINKAMEQDPFSERIWDNKIMILTYARRFKEAIAFKDSLNGVFPDQHSFYDMIAECYYWLGEKDSSMRAAYLAGDEFYQFWKTYTSNDKKQIQSLIDESIKQPEKTNYETLAIYYTAAGQYDKAIKELETALDAREYSWLKFLNVDPTWDPLHNNRQFQQLLQKAGFK